MSHITARFTPGDFSCDILGDSSLIPLLFMYTEMCMYPGIKIHSSCAFESRGY